MLEQVEESAEPEAVPEPEAEVAAPEPQAEAPAEQPEVVAGDGSTLEDRLGWNGGGGGGGDGSWSGDEDWQGSDIADVSGETLREHLLWQLRLEHMSPREFALGQAIVDAINEDGYLTESLDTICQPCCARARRHDPGSGAVLGVVQQLDPAGVGARDRCRSACSSSSPCSTPDTPGLELARRLAAEHLELLAARQYAALRRRLRASEEEIDEAVALVRALQPRPGAAVQRSTAEYVVPDVFVRKVGAQWIVELNPWAAPRVRVNQAYAGEIGRGAGALGTARAAPGGALARAQPRDPQRDSPQGCEAHRGEAARVPRARRGVDEAHGAARRRGGRIHARIHHLARDDEQVHAHAARRVRVPLLLLEPGWRGRQEHSSTAIRALIRKMIANESPDQPLSDSRIAELLVEGGITVARRTVAKYREAMTIPSSAERRHLGLR